MNKNQQLLLGVGVLAVAGYLIWQQSQKPKSFANLAARRSGGGMGLGGPCGKGKGICCYAKDYDKEAGKWNCCKGHQEDAAQVLGCPGGSGISGYGGVMEF